MKQCKSCNQVLPETKFKFRSQGGRQRGQRNSMCNRCLYVKYTRPNADKKLKEVQDYQMEKGCADCGYAAHPAAMEFDHVNGDDKCFNIGEKIGAYTREVIWAEIAKCEVVCANCHAIRTANRRELVTIPDAESSSKHTISRRERDGRD